MDSTTQQMQVDPLLQVEDPRVIGNTQTASTIDLR